LFDIWLPIAQQKMNVFLLCGFGLGVGFLSGFFGVGGGFIMTPLLMALGVPPSVAVGSGLAIMLGASLSGTVRHTQLGTVDFKLALLLLPGSFLGVQAGAILLNALKTTGSFHFNGGAINTAHFFLSLCFMALLFGVGISTLFESSPAPAASPDVHVTPPLALRMQGLRLPPYISLNGSGVDRFPFLFILVGGLLVGVMAGLLGVGGGILMLPFMMYFIGIKAHRAVGTSLCQICFTAAFGAVIHARLGNVDPILAIVVLAGSLVGARLGASTTSKVHSLHLRRYFALFSVAVGLVVGISFIRELFFRH
jgi:hypothetical protein